METTKKKSRDSVFVDLFRHKKYVLQLYKELHPEDADITEDDISIATLESVIVNTIYNDLGFIVRNKFILLVEAQTKWNPNIILRLLFYLFESYRRYLFDTNQSEHSYKKVHIPKPELYVVYSGNKKVKNEMSFAEEFFDGDSLVDAKIQVLNIVDETICGQYLGFCKEFEEMKNIHEDGIKCAQETVRRCIEKGYLAEYFAEHEKEAITMMENLFDEEYQRELFQRAEANRNMEIGYRLGEEKGMEKGKNEGIISTLFGLVRDGILSLSDAAKRAGMTVPEFEEKSAKLALQ